MTDAPADRALDARVESASVGLAVPMNLALLSSVWLSRSEPTALTGLFGVLGVALYLTRFERPRSWLPTLITFVRLLMTTALGLWGASWSGVEVVAMVLSVFTLDAFDGALARRTNSVSVMGGHLDGETDAVLTAMVCLFLYLRGLGPWVLTAGFLRFVYVLVVRFAPASQGQAPRSRLAARAFGIALVSFLVGFLPLPAPLAFLAWFAPLFATLLLCWSFGRSFYWSFLARA